MNTAETRLFSKSEHLYALDIAKETISKTRNITVVEGYTDVVMAHQFGVSDVVAVLGTALGPRHVRNLKRFADRITLVLDGDAAGQRRTNEVLEYFVAAQVDLRILTLARGIRSVRVLSGTRRGGVASNSLNGRRCAGAQDSQRDGGDRSGPRQPRCNKALEEILGTLAHAPVDPLGTPEASRLREQQ